MRTSVALGVLAMFALATPAFSQAAGDAGANGAAGPATGHNTPGSAGTNSPASSGEMQPLNENAVGPRRRAKCSYRR